MVIVDHKDEEDPWRYPFADIFIFQENPIHHILACRNVLRDIKFLEKYPAEVGLDPLIKWPNGTKLVHFGEFEIRVSIDNGK